MHFWATRSSSAAKRIAPGIASQYATFTPNGSLHPVSIASHPSINPVRRIPMRIDAPAMPIAPIPIATAAIPRGAVRATRRSSDSVAKRRHPCIVHDDATSIWPPLWSCTDEVAGIDLDRPSPLRDKQSAVCSMLDRNVLRLGRRPTHNKCQASGNRDAAALTHTQTILGRDWGLSRTSAAQPCSRSVQTSALLHEAKRFGRATGREPDGGRPGFPVTRRGHDKLLKRLEKRSAV